MTATTGGLELQSLIKDFVRVEDQGQNLDRPKRRRESENEAR